MTLALDDRPVNSTTSPVSRRAETTRTIAERPARRRLGGRSHRALLIGHVLASVGWFGLSLTVAFLAMAGSSRDNVAFYDAIDATLTLSIPLGFIAAATGIALSLTTRWGLVRHWWVVGKQAITVAVIATDVLVVAPTMSDAVDQGHVVGIPGPVYAHCVVLAIATILSMWKPKARTPYGKRPARQ